MEAPLDVDSINLPRLLPFALHKLLSATGASVSGASPTGASASADVTPSGVTSQPVTLPMSLWWPYGGGPADVTALLALSRSSAWTIGGQIYSLLDLQCAVLHSRPTFTPSVEHPATELATMTSTSMSRSSEGGVNANTVAAAEAEAAAPMMHVFSFLPAPIPFRQPHQSTAATAAAGGTAHSSAMINGGLGGSGGRMMPSLLSIGQLRGHQLHTTQPPSWAIAALSASTPATATSTSCSTPAPSVSAASTSRDETIGVPATQSGGTAAASARGAGAGDAGVVDDAGLVAMGARVLADSGGDISFAWLTQLTSNELWILLQYVDAQIISSSSSSSHPHPPPPHPHLIHERLAAALVVTASSLGIPSVTQLVTGASLQRRLDEAIALNRQSHHPSTLAVTTNASEVSQASSSSSSSSSASSSSSSPSLTGVNIDVLLSATSGPFEQLRTELTLLKRMTY